MGRTRDFERQVLPHLDAACNLARWLVRDEQAAEDIAQEAALRAFRHFANLRGDDARPWLLGIVRNACMTWLAARHRSPEVQAAPEDDHDDAAPLFDAPAGADPLAHLEGDELRRAIDAALRALAPVYREVVVLRELEGLSYADIARIVAVPAGTVMSRLSRGRALLRVALASARSGK